jgi:hypothetical protein
MRQVPVQLLVCSLLTVIFASSWGGHPLPQHCHSPPLLAFTASSLPLTSYFSPRSHFSTRLALLSRIGRLVSLPLCLSSHCLLSSSLWRRLSSLGHTYLLSPPSASCPPLVNLCLKKCDLLLSFHVNLSALASALLAVLPSPTTSHPFVTAFPLA